MLLSRDVPILILIRPGMGTGQAHGAVRAEGQPHARWLGPNVCQRTSRAIGKKHCCGCGRYDGFMHSRKLAGHDLMPDTP